MPHDHDDISAPYVPDPIPKGHVPVSFPAGSRAPSADAIARTAANLLGMLAPDERLSDDVLALKWVYMTSLAWLKVVEPLGAWARGVDRGARSHFPATTLVMDLMAAFESAKTIERAYHSTAARPVASAPAVEAAPVPLARTYQDALDDMATLVERQHTELEIARLQAKLAGDKPSQERAVQMGGAWADMSLLLAGLRRRVTKIENGKIVASVPDGAK